MLAAETHPVVLPGAPVDGPAGEAACASPRPAARHQALQRASQLPGLRHEGAGGALGPDGFSGEEDGRWDMRWAEQGGAGWKEGSRRG